MACPPSASLLPNQISSSSSGNSSEAVLQQMGPSESSHGAEQIEEALRVLRAITPSSLEKSVVLDCSVSRMRLPTVKSLVDDLATRMWSETVRFSSPMVYAPVCVPGYQPPGSTPNEILQNEALDKERLLTAVKVNNAMFANLLTLLDEEKAEGYVVNIQLPAGTKLSTRGDVHGDLATVLATLRMLQKNGLLDEQFHCVRGARLLFDGDFVDRSVNDITTLLLLLCLRIENFGLVELIRGNHESMSIQAGYSMESQFFLAHSSEFTQCYRTMPLAGCIAGIQKAPKRPDYLHISHGGLSVAVDLVPLFRSRADLLLIPTKPENSPRMCSLAESANPKIAQAFKRLQDSVLANQRDWVSYLWDDIASEIIDTGRNMPGASTLTPELLEDYAEVNSCDEGKIKWYERGHKHFWEEWAVQSKKIGMKVYITTLSTGTKGGFYSRSGLQKKQGLVLTVGEEIKTWKKQVICWDGTNPAYLHPQEYALYDCSFSEKEER